MGLGGRRSASSTSRPCANRIKLASRPGSSTTCVDLLRSQGVRIIQGTARLKGPHEVVVETADGVRELEADAVLLSTGSRPRIPDWAEVDGDRVLTTRDAYPPPEMPEHLVVIGSGVTGVEFVHMFSSLGCQVTLIVSRQQVLPQKDPEVAAALEDELPAAGRAACSRAPGPTGIDRTDDGGVAVRCDDGRVAEGSHALLAIGSIPNSDGLGLDAAGVEVDERRLRARSTTTASPTCRTSTPPATCRGSCRCRRWRRCRAARSPST